MSILTLLTVNAHDSWGQAAVMPGWKNPGWRGNPNPVVRPRPKPVPRPYSGYWEEVGYQVWGLGKGGCKAAYEMAHGMGDLAYGAVQCGGYAIGCGAWGLGVVDNPARLVPPNPGSWQSGSITAYDLQCKNGQGSQALCEMVINAATFNILPTCEAIADSLCSGSDEGMQAIGGLGVGVAVPALLGPVVRPVMRPRPVVQPVQPGGRIPLPMVQEPISLPVMLELASEPNCGLRAFCFRGSAPYRYVPSLGEVEQSTVSLICNRIKDTFQKIPSRPNRPYRADDGFWEVMLGPEQGPRVASWLQEETGASAGGWWLLKYYQRKNGSKYLEYHFAYHPERDLTLLHYFKQCGRCGNPRK